MPEVKMPEHVRLLIAWIRLIIARGAFNDDKSHMSLLPYDLMFSRIEQICTLALAEPNEYIRLLMAPYFSREPMFENTRYTSDRFIILAAVQENGGTLYYASEELCGDREIVLAAVQQDGWALEYVSEELRGDREIVLEAVQKYEYALCYASPELREQLEREGY